MKTTLYDRDVADVIVGGEGETIYVIYYAPTYSGVFTKEDLEYMLWVLDNEG